MAEAIAQTDLDCRKWGESRIMGSRTIRYTWWVHWRELAKFFLPRRYRWLVTANENNRGSQINQAILDSSGCVYAREMAAGLLSGKSSPARKWFKLMVGNIDSTGNNPISRWLAECERLLYLIFHESNFYTSMAIYYFDLVIFGTATMIIYEDFDNVIQCYVPCAGEYYVELDGKFRPTYLYREYTMSIQALVDEFGIDNVSPAVKAAYEDKAGGDTTLDVVVAHAIEPNNDGRAKKFGFSERFAFREYYWEWGQTAQPQASGNTHRGLLRKRGFFEQPQATCRWDITGNDAYGRSTGMDALPDQMQIQLEQRRKAQGIDKMVNPPLVADIQLKNQPASLLPGGMTYVTGYTSSGKPGISSIYDTKFPVKDMAEDIAQAIMRLAKTFYNDLFRTMSQYVTRSNVSPTEVDQRKAESMIMLGPAIERVDHEGLAVIMERAFGITQRAGILPPPPAEIAGAPMNIKFVSMLARAQSASEAAGIERLMQVAGNWAGVTGPEVIDKIDVDKSIDKYNALLGNDPEIMRTQEDTDKIRQNRAAQAEQQRQAEMADLISKGAKNLAQTDVGGGQSALNMMLGGPKP